MNYFDIRIRLITHLHDLAEKYSNFESVQCDRMWRLFVNICKINIWTIAQKIARVGSKFDQI